MASGTYKKKNRVVLCYNQSHLHEDSAILNTLRNQLAESGIRFQDIHLDGDFGRLVWAGISDMILASIWVVIVFTPQSVDTGEAVLTQMIATECSRMSKTKNIIVICHSSLKGFVQPWLVAVSTIIEVHDAKWTESVISLVLQKPKVLGDFEPCKNPDHLDLKQLTLKQHLHMSDPDDVLNDGKTKSRKKGKMTNPQRTLLRRRRQDLELYKPMSRALKFTLTTDRFIEILEEWTWNIAKVTGVVPFNAEKISFDIGVGCDELSIQLKDTVPMDIKPQVWVKSSYMCESAPDCIENHIMQAFDNPLAVFVDFERKTDLDKTVLLFHRIDKTSNRFSFAREVNIKGSINGYVKDIHGNCLMAIRSDVRRVFEMLNLTNCVTVDIGVSVTCRYEKETAIVAKVVDKNGRIIFSKYELLLSPF